MAVAPHTASPVHYGPGALPNLPDPPHHDPMTADGMTPEDTILWLNGALDLLSDKPPSQDQWNTMRAKIAEQVGAIVHERMQRHLNYQQQRSGVNAQILGVQQLAAISKQLSASAMSALNTRPGD